MTFPAIFFFQENGLFFLGYSSSLHKFDRMLQRMFMTGEEEKKDSSEKGDSEKGNSNSHFHRGHDRLLSYTKPLSGSYFYVPSIKELENLLK